MQAVVSWSPDAAGGAELAPCPGFVGSQRGPEVTLFWWDVMGMSWTCLGGG